MKVCLNVSRLEDGEIGKMIRATRQKAGIALSMASPGNEVYLCVDAPDLRAGEEQIRIVSELYKEKRLGDPLYFGEGEYLTKEEFEDRLRTRRILEEVDDDMHRWGREPRSGEYRREDCDVF